MIGTVLILLWEASFSKASWQTYNPLLYKCIPVVELGSIMVIFEDQLTCLALNNLLCSDLYSQSSTSDLLSTGFLQEINVNKWIKNTSNTPGCIFFSLIQHTLDSQLVEHIVDVFVIKNTCTIHV